MKSPFHRPNLFVFFLCLFSGLFVVPDLPMRGGFTGPALWAQQNPFLSGSTSEGHKAGSVSNALEAPEVQEAPDGPPVPAGSRGDAATDFEEGSAPSRIGRAQTSLMWHISKLQRQLYSSLAELMGSIQSSKGNPRFLFLLLLAACIYGMIHALGPGHRKTVIFSYFLAEDARLARGIGAGVVMALLHGASAAVIILPLYYLVRGSLLLTFNSLSRYVEMGSFLFLSLFGAVMFLLHLLPLLKKRTPGRIRQGEKPKEESARSSRELLLLILGSGLVPCPGAAMILIFALSLDMVFHGLLAVAAMSVGMAITLSLVALASMGARKGLGRSTRRHHRTAAFLHTVLELGGYGLIMLFGLVMLLGMV